MQLAVFFVWLTLLVATIIFKPWWESHSYWYKHRSTEQDRLSIVMISVFLPLLAIAFMWWDLAHNNRHQTEFREDLKENHRT